MKKIIILSFVLSVVMIGFILAELASAASTTITPQAVYQSPITTVTDSNINLAVARTDAVLTYADTDSGWSLASYAGIKIGGDPAANMVVTVPASANLTSGTKTATMPLVGRCNTGSYAATKAGGSACGAGFAVGGDGFLYLSVFPTGITLAQNSGATYTGSITVSVDYQ